MKKILRSFSLPENVVQILEKEIPNRQRSDYLAQLIIKDYSERLILKENKKTFKDLAKLGDTIRSKSNLKSVEDVLNVIKKGRK